VIGFVGLVGWVGGCLLTSPSQQISKCVYDIVEAQVLMEKNSVCVLFIFSVSLLIALLFALQ